MKRGDFVKNLKINKKALSILLLTTMITGTGFSINFGKKDTNYELKSMPLAEFLEDEELKNLTTIDEETINGNIDIILKDEEIRKQIMMLEYYESSGEEDLYNQTLNYLRSAIKSNSEDELLLSVKGAIADEEKTSIDNIKLTPAADYDEDSLFIPATGVAEIKKDYKKEGYKIKSKLLNEAINLTADIQNKDLSEVNAKDLIELYDNATETAEMAIAAGASRRDNKFYEKNSKKMIKKNFNF